jgi:Spy/CpxP family protein refolding chaperone
VLGGLVILATGAPPVQAHSWRSRGTVELREQLGLDEQQARAVREQAERRREARRQLLQSLAEARQALRALILDGADEAAIQAKLAQVRELTGQLLDLGAQALRDLAQVLTPEQREKLRSLRPGPRPIRFPLAG